MPPDRSWDLKSANSPQPGADDAVGRRSGGVPMRCAFAAYRFADEYADFRSPISRVLASNTGTKDPGLATEITAGNRQL